MLCSCSVFNYVKARNITTESIYPFTSYSGTTGVLLCVCVFVCVCGKGGSEGYVSFCVQCDHIVMCAMAKNAPWMSVFMMCRVLQECSP